MTLIVRVLTMLSYANDLSAVFSRWRIWFIMANQDIALRYKRSVIGPFWISISLAATVAGLSLLYGQLFQREFKEYILFLGSGLLVWRLISDVIHEGCLGAVEASPHLRSIHMPMSVIAARIVHRNAIVFLHNAVVIVGMFVIFGHLPGPAFAIAPLGFALLLLIGFFGAQVLGPLCLRFRDLTQIVSNIIQIAFFLTPILWSPDQGRVQSWIVEFNPFYHMIELVRAPIRGHLPTELNWMVSFGVLAVCASLAFLSVSLSRKKMFLWL